MVGRIAVALLLCATPALAPIDLQDSSGVLLAQGKQTRQAVIETTAGTIVMDLLADKAPSRRP